MLRSARSLALLLLAACEASEPEGEGSPASQAAAWEFATTPDFLAPGGVVDGDSIHFFGISGGEFLSDGNAVVVLGRRQNRLVVLDPGGQVVRVLGGLGDGPEEFPSVPTILRSGGRLVVLDRSRRRYRELEEGLSEPRAYERGAGQLELGLYEDGAVIAGLERYPTAREAYVQRQVTTPYYLWTDQSVDTLVGPSSPPAPGFVVGQLPNGNVMSVVLPGQCLPVNLYAFADSTLLIADASTGVLMSLSRTGAIDTLYQTQDARGVVTQAMVDGARRLAANDSLVSPEYRGSFLESVGEPGDPLRSFWSGVLWDGRLLWLRRAGPCLFGAENVEPSLWDVIDVESRSRVAVVEMPAALRLLAVASDRVLAVTRDALDIDRVGVYRINR